MNPPARSGRAHSMSDGAVRPPDDYLLPNDRERSLGRLRLLEQTYDGVTSRWFDRLGVGPGWRCLDVGAGSGSVAERLDDLVGPAGEVVALDIDPALLHREMRRAGRDRVIVRPGDVRRDALVPEGHPGFDLVHARMVLAHLSDRREVLDSLVAALRPGGWLVVADGDSFAIDCLGDPTHSVVVGGASDVTSAVGTGEWPRRLPATLQGAGLRDVVAGCETPLVEGGSPHARWLAMTVGQLDEQGLLEDIDGEARRRWYADAERAGHWMPGLALVVAAGRRHNRTTALTSE